MAKTGNIFKKANRNFFCFAEHKYATYLLNQNMQLTNDRNVSSTISAKVPSIK